MHRLAMGSLIIPYALLLIFTCTRGEEASSNTNVHCTESGVFPIQGTCRKYYECYKWNRQFELRPLECLPDMYFDEVSSSCRTLLPSYTPPQCQNRTNTVSKNADTLRRYQFPIHNPDVDSTQHPEITSSQHSEVSPGLSEVVPYTPQSVSTEFPELSTTSLSISPAHGISESHPAFNSSQIDIANNETYSCVDKNCTFVNTSETGLEIIPSTLPSLPALTICNYSNIVSNYTTLLLSPPLRESLEYQTEFNKLTKRYNIILEKVKTNSLIWSSGESILGGIKNVYSRSSEYERDFNRMFEIYQREILKPFNTEELIEQLQGDIRELQEDIKDNREGLNMTDNPRVMRFFTNNILAKEQQILRKQEELDRSSKEARDLEEILYFLGRVKNDATTIENLVKSTNIKIQTLSSTHKNDLEELEQFSTQVKASLQTLIEEEKEHETDLSLNREKLESIDLLKDSQDDVLDTLNNDTRANTLEIRRFQDEMNRKQEEFENKVEILCSENILTFHLEKKKKRITVENKQRECDRILRRKGISLDILHEQTEMQRLLDENKHKQLRISTILSERKNANKYIQDLVNIEPGLNTKIQETNSELLNVRLLFKALMHLITSANHANDALTDISDIFPKTFHQFEHTVNEIDLMNSIGKAAENNQQRHAAKLEIEEKVLELQSQIALIEAGGDMMTCI